MPRTLEQYRREDNSAMKNRRLFDWMRTSLVNHPSNSGPEGGNDQYPGLYFLYFRLVIREEIFRNRRIGIKSLPLNDLREFIFQFPMDGGEGGIRTPDSLTTMPDFESGAFNRALPPLRGFVRAVRKRNHASNESRELRSRRSGAEAPVASEAAKLPTRPENTAFSGGSSNGGNSLVA